MHSDGTTYHLVTHLSFTTSKYIIPPLDKLALQSVYSRHYKLSNSAEYGSDIGVTRKHTLKNVHTYTAPSGESIGPVTERSLV
jgi:hypothetical protein